MRNFIHELLQFIAIAGRTVDERKVIVAEAYYAAM
jgi:hypothetical protein